MDRRIAAVQEILRWRGAVIRDFNSADGESRFTCDLCIVGSGAAGLAIAMEFINTGRSVLLVESGGAEFDPAVQALNACDIAGLPFNGATEGRCRVFGGSTTAWGGQCIRYAASVFAKRAHVPDSGWPLSAADIAPWYDRASRFLGLDAMDYADGMFDALGIAKLRFADQTFDHEFAKWLPRPNIRELHAQAIRRARNLTLLLNASVVELEAGADQQVVGAVIKSLGGRTASITARHFVLCAGGLENARLLLASSRVMPAGIGNGHDLVGRYFQDHPAATVGLLRPATLSIRRYLATRIRNGTKYTFRFNLSDAAQQQHGLLAASFSAMLLPDALFDEVRAIWFALARRQGLLTVVPRALRAMLRPELYEIAFNYLARGIVLHPSGDIRLNVLLEQAPDRDSRVTLSGERDALGVPKARIQWRVGDMTCRTLGVAARLLQQEFARLGLGELVLDEAVLDADAARPRLTDQAHHIGTTRMHASPRLGVVDENCRVHGMQNLHVAGSSVFPTGGHSSPTLTIVALSMRLADHLRAAWDG